MSSLYTRWDMYTTSSICAVSSISTLMDVNIGRNLSTRRRGRSLRTSETSGNTGAS
jgi:hypothetical protein